LSQLNWPALFKPRRIYWFRNVGFSIIRFTAWAIARGLSGSTIRAAFPTTSGKDVLFEVTTGTPQAKASSTGKPNPYKREG